MIDNDGGQWLETSPRNIAGGGSSSSARRSTNKNRTMMTSKRIFGVVCISVVGSAIWMQLSEFVFPATNMKVSDSNGGEIVIVDRSSTSSSSFSSASSWALPINTSVLMGDLTKADSNTTATKIIFSPEIVSIEATSGEKDEVENAADLVIVMESPSSSVNEVSIRTDATLPKNKTSVADERVKQIILLGERHSGTNWITDYLTSCFDIKVNDNS